MAPPQPSPLLAIIVAVIVIAAGIGGIAYLYYEVNHKPPAASGLRVQQGDNVTVNYIGVFAAGPQQGRVFDTSEYSVALNNASWPKSLFYTSRGGSPSDYTPLAVFVGPSTPSGGYTIGNLTFSSVVPGFWQGLVGVPGNQTKYITVPQNLGYPSTLINSSCFITRPLNSIYPVVVTLTPSQFSEIFQNISITPGTQFTDPVYGWTDLILSTNSSAVTYENLPTLGMTISPNGWPVTVANITASTISLQSQLTPAQAGMVRGHGAGTLCGVSSFIVTQVNLGAGTYVADYGGITSSGSQAGNQEVYGQQLIFIVSVVDIFRP
jgi:hypothetical protein